MMAICTKCGETHEVDTSKVGWSVLCERCRPEWDMRRRGWMREKHKAMVSKRKRAMREAKR